MFAGARRGRRKPALGLRDAASPPSPPGAGDDDLFLRLALAQGNLGLETTRAVKVGPFEVTELSIRLVGVRFPIDLSGGVRRFRHMRGAIQKARVELPLMDGAIASLARARSALPNAARVVLASTQHGLTVGIALADGALAFDVVVAPLGQHLRLIVERARGDALEGAPHVLACRAAAALLGAWAERTGSALIVRDPFQRFARLLLPDAGARVPSTSELVLDVRVSDDGRAGRVAIAAEAGVAAAALSMRAVRALETCELLTDADEAAFEGDVERARAAYLQALEIAPRHEEAAARLAALDVWTGGRDEAALATLADIASPTSAGLLGSAVLEAVGETDAAYAAACSAAAEEPFGVLAARAWARASRLAPSDAAASSALDEALARSPSLEAARWMRIERRLAVGDVMSALGDTEHLEANAAGKDERHAVLQRAAELFFARGQLDEAEKLFERSLRYEPRSARAVAGLARTLRDRGKTTRALDLFARASALGKREPTAAHAIDLELAEALALYAGDRPAAIARVAGIPQDAEVAPQARVSEATWRSELGDVAGAARALARLRSIAETTTAVLVATRDRLVRALLAAATMDESLGEAKAARRDLELAVRHHPQNREATQRLAKLVRLQPPEHVPAPEPEVDEGALDARAETLTARLRADPNDERVIAQLAEVLERLGRDMELFALVSARLEDRPDAAELLDVRERVLRRLAETARREGRLSEAELYESMLSVR